MEKRKELKKKRRTEGETERREGGGRKRQNSGRKNASRGGGGEGRTRNWLEIESRKDNDNGDMVTRRRDTGHKKGKTKRGNWKQKGGMGNEKGERERGSELVEQDGNSYVINILRFPEQRLQIN